MIREIEQNVTSQGGKFEDYLSSLGKSYDQLMLDLLPTAVKRVKSALAFKEISKLEKIEVEEKEIDQEMELLKERYKGNSEVLANISGVAYRAYLSNFILNQKVIDNLKKWNLV